MFIPYMNGPWTPAQLIIPPALWLDARRADTITENLGKVSQWDDLSGNNNHAKQDTEANQPTYASSKLTYDGTDYVSLELINRITDARTVFIVCKWADKTGDNRVILGDSTLGGTFNWHGDTETSGNLLSSVNSDINIRAGSKYINGSLTSGLLERYIEDTIYTFETLGNVVIGSISQDRGISGRQFKGDYYELIVLDYVPTTETRQKIEVYLQAKWNTPALP